MQILCENLSIGYGNMVLHHNINLSVNKGDYLCIIGENGCGKSTLMNMLGGLDIPDFGGVWIRNTSLKDLSKEERTIFRRRNIEI